MTNNHDLGSCSRKNNERVHRTYGGEKARDGNVSRQGSRKQNIFSSAGVLVIRYLYELRKGKQNRNLNPK